MPPQNIYNVQRKTFKSNHEIFVFIATASSERSEESVQIWTDPTLLAHLDCHKSIKCI